MRRRRWDTCESDGGRDETKETVRTDGDSLAESTKLSRTDLSGEELSSRSRYIYYMFNYQAEAPYRPAGESTLNGVVSR